MSNLGPAAANRKQHLLINFMHFSIRPIPRLTPREDGMSILLEGSLAGWGWVLALRHGGSRI